MTSSLVERGYNRVIGHGFTSVAERQLCLSSCCFLAYSPRARRPETFVLSNVRTAVKFVEFFWAGEAVRLTCTRFRASERQK